MVEDHEFSMYTKRINLSNKLLESILAKLNISNYILFKDGNNKSNGDISVIKYNKNGTMEFLRKTDYHRLVSWLSDSSDISDITFYTNHRIDETASARISLIYPMRPEGKHYLICKVVTHNFMREPENRNEAQQKNERFNRVFSLVKNIADLIHPFYGHAYPGSLFNTDDYIYDIIFKMKAANPFDVTLWSNVYPTMPDHRTQDLLKAAGYVIEKFNDGIWLYLPPDKWYTNEYFKARGSALQLLKVSDDEYKYFI